MLTVEPAAADDHPALRGLIRSAGLPLDGFGAVPTATFVARDGGVVVGTVSLESHGDQGMLRSLAVASDRRGEGIGSRLVDTVEQHAARSGLDGIYLLTETAEGFFADRGYAVIGRDDAPAPVMASVEWSIACGDNAVPMVLRAR